MEEKYNSFIPNVDSKESLTRLLKGYYDIESLRKNEVYFYLMVSSHIETFEKQIKRLNKNYRKFKANLKKISSNKKSELFKLNLTHKKSKYKEEGKALFIVNNENDYILGLSDYPGDFFDSLIQFTNKLYPIFERVFIPSKVIKRILEDFIEADYSGYCTLISTKFWWKEVDKEEPSVNLKFPGKKVPLKKVLDQLEKDQLIDTFIGGIKNKDLDLLKFYISRKGIFKYKGGSWDLFKTQILNRIKSSGVTKFNSFKGIERSKEETSELSVNFGKLKRFEKRAAMKNFSASIEGESTFVQTVYHKGNPYFHASVTDRNDGSSFEVLFIERNNKFKLKVLPGFAVTPLSMLRFFKTIFSEFGEGEIKKKRRS